ncbi:helix-turn-helix domain-containing protein [Halosimplex halophilum]|uniref:ArsR family transcriptional regulator n=1 Tax=Halosimplex halophilum TaxID=2559572 RepID=UPI00107F51A8|nr:ArsR family transcriptional regulator [Halosimplex halophilum]
MNALSQVMTESNLDSILAAVESTVRANILADIVGHPHGIPTLVEIDYMNPNIGRSELQNQLSVLEEEEVIKSVKHNQQVFYYLTEQARQVFDENQIFDEESYRAAYQEVTKPPEIIEVEEMQRPSTSGDHPSPRDKH